MLDPGHFSYLVDLVTDPTAHSMHMHRIEMKADVSAVGRSFTTLRRQVTWGQVFLPFIFWL